MQLVADPDAIYNSHGIPKLGQAETACSIYLGPQFHWTRQLEAAVYGLPVTLSLPSDFRVLPAARAAVEALCMEGGIDPGATSALTIAVHEAISNVIRHAHRNCPESYFQIHCLLASDRVEIRIVDEGEPFDLTAVPYLDPSELRFGGRGIYLMRTLMDELTCMSRGERGNVLRMVKFCERNSHRSHCS